MEAPTDGKNALWVKVTDDYSAVACAIYNVWPNGHPSVPGSVESGQSVAEFAAGVRLTPEQCYEIAQRFTMCGMAIEDRRKNGA